jgi:hypothetical protein
MGRTLSAAVRNLARLAPLELVITAAAAAAYLPLFGVARLLSRGRTPREGGFRPSRARAEPPA